MRNDNQALKKARVPRKTWSYRQLTEATETRILFLADFLKKQLARHPNDRLNHMTVNQVSSWAYGAFNLWKAVTEGWQEPGDEQRLRQLADSLDIAGNDKEGQA